MKKTINWGSAAGYGLLAVLCVAFVFYYSWVNGQKDTTPPEITVPETVLQTSIYVEDAIVLEGVSAKDDKDGDVTDSVVIERYSDIYNGNKSSVTFAAFDAAGNVAKAQRPVEFVDYQRPRFTLSGSLIFRQGTAFDLFRQVGAVDALDGRLDSRVKGSLVSGGTEIEEPGLYEVEFRVTNGLGETVHLTLPVEVTASDVSRSAPELEDYLIYVKKGDGFDARAWLKAESPQLGPDGEVLNAVRVASNVNTAEAGVYTVDYARGKKDSKNYGRSRLIVVVEE